MNSVRRQFSIVPDSERKETTKTFETKVDNVKPNGTFSKRAEAKGDVVFAIGKSQVAGDVQNSSLTFQNRFVVLSQAPILWM